MTIFDINICTYQLFFVILQRKTAKSNKIRVMSYTQMAQLEVLNAVRGISSEVELREFRDLIAHFFAEKAQKAIDSLWNNGQITQKTVDAWGNEHMRTPYRHASHRS